MANHVDSSCNLVTEPSGLSWWPCVCELDSTAATPPKLPLRPGGTDENRSWNWLDSHNPLHGPFEPVRATICDEPRIRYYPTSQQSQSATSRPGNTPTSSLALLVQDHREALFFPRTFPGLDPEERACIAHLRPLPKCPSHISLKRQSTGVMHNRLHALLHGPSHSSSICKAHTYPLRPVSKDSS